MHYFKAACSLIGGRADRGRIVTETSRLEARRPKNGMMHDTPKNTGKKMYGFKCDKKSVAFIHGGSQERNLVGVTNRNQASRANACHILAPLELPQRTHHPVLLDTGVSNLSRGPYVRRILCVSRPAHDKQHHGAKQNYAAASRIYAFLCAAGTNELI